MDLAVEQRRRAAAKLDAACTAAGCAPEELAEHVARMGVIVAKCCNVVKASPGELVEKVEEMRTALENIGDATRDGMRVVTAQRDDARDAARKMAHLLHRMNDDGHKLRAEEIDTILREGGVE